MTVDSADDRGIPAPQIRAGRGLTDGGGRQPRGLQNRLRGAVEASWVGSIPIHPRHISGGEERVARTAELSPWNNHWLFRLDDA